MVTKGYLNIFHTVGLGLNMGLSAATAGFELTTYERNATTLRIALTDQTLEMTYFEKLFSVRWVFPQLYYHKLGHKY